MEKEKQSESDCERPSKEKNRDGKGERGSQTNTDSAKTERRKITLGRERALKLIKRKRKIQKRMK